MLVASLLDADTWPPIVAVFVLLSASLAYIIEPDVDELLTICIPVAAVITATIALAGLAVGVLG